MTKKQKRITIFFILLGLLPPLIIVGGLVTYIIIFNTFFTYKETFHKPCSIYNGNSSCTFADNNGSVYCFLENKIQKLHIGKNPTGFFPKETSGIYGFQVNDVCVNEKYIFATTSKLTSTLDCQIVIFDKNMKEIERINSEHYIKSITASNDCLYCAFDFIGSNSEHDNHIGLAKYSLSTLEKTIISDNIDSNTIYYDNSTLLYLSGKSTFTKLYSNNDAVFYTHISYPLLIFHPLAEIIEFNVEDSLISFKYQNHIYYHDFPYRKNHILNRIRVINNTLILGIEETLEGNGCVPEHKCICQTGKTTLVRFDLMSNSFLEDVEYPAGTFLIDYDNDGGMYYYDGGLYNHDTLIRNCDTLQIKDKVVVKNKEYFSVKSDNHYIEYYNGQFYGI